MAFKYNIDYIVKFNWEIPEFIEWHSFIEDLEDEKYKIKKKNKIYFLVEGFLLFKQPLCYKFNKSIFIYVAKVIDKKRRMEAKPVPEDIYETLVWPNYLKNEKNKEKNFGGVGDILVLDSIKEIPEEIPDKSIKFIFNKKDSKRNLEK